MRRKWWYASGPESPTRRGPCRPRRRSPGRCAMPLQPSPWWSTFSCCGARSGRSRLWRRRHGTFSRRGTRSSGRWRTAAASAASCAAAQDRVDQRTTQDAGVQVLHDVVGVTSVGAGILAGHRADLVVVADAVAADAAGELYWCQPILSSSRSASVRVAAGIFDGQN